MIVYEQIFKKFGLSPTQLEILKLVGKKKTILEIGSSSGYMTRAFLRNECIVDVVECDQKAVAKLPKQVRRILNVSIENDGIFKSLEKFDFIIMADVLEHLVNPEQVLKRLCEVSFVNTKLLISLPNIASWPMRKQLFFKGDFQYQESGLLDRTHLHFYTVNTLPEVLKKNGWKVLEIAGTITRLPLEGLIGKIPLFGWFFKKNIYQRVVNKYKNLAYCHFLVVASKK